MSWSRTLQPAGDEQSLLRVEASLGRAPDCHHYLCVYGCGNTASIRGPSLDQKTL